MPGLVDPGVVLFGDTVSGVLVFGMVVPGVLPGEVWGSGVVGVHGAFAVPVAVVLELPVVPVPGVVLLVPVVTEPADVHGLRFPAVEPGPMPVVGAGV